MTLFRNITGRVAIHTILILLSVVFIVPILILISTSISSEAQIAGYGYSIFPRLIDFTAYRYIFKNPASIISGYKVTIIVSVVGTLAGMMIMMMCAYALSRRHFKYRRIVNFYLFFTMLFGGGLIPTYILTTQYLHLQNTMWVIILSQLVNVWYVFILRTFIKDIPEAIIESAMIDGASEFKIFLYIILPMSKPAIATIGLFTLLAYWNEWMTALLYINKPELYTLQYLLQKIMLNLQAMLQNMNKVPSNMATTEAIPSETARMAMVIIAAGPMIVIMPFFQKYFTRGMTIGAVKG